MQWQYTQQHSYLQAEKGIKEKMFTAEDVPHITHYFAQMKVCNHAYAQVYLTLQVRLPTYPSQPFNSSPLKVVVGSKA
jgi:hypothetical protein